VESLVMAYTFAKNQSACVEAAAREAPSMPRDRSFVNTVSLALDCSKPGMPEVPALQKLGEEGLKIPGVLADDISGLYFTLASSYRAEKDEADATRIGTERVEYLRRQLAKTPNPEARMAYVLQLVSAANFLHKPDLALPEVQRAERELPKDYNPPRLEAGLYRDLGRYDDALQACDRAMGKAYGLAKLRLYLLRGKIQELNGEPEAAKKTYNDGVAFGQTLPESAAKGTVKALEDALGAVGQLKRR
jgi:tetratricopeptide (TPR) repeat protein